MYISKSLSKFLCQFTIVIATERKGGKKNDDDNILVFGFEFVRDFSKKFHVVWSFSVTFSCGEESLGPPESVSNQESPLQLECSRYDSSVDETQLS